MAARTSTGRTPSLLPAGMDLAEGPTLPPGEEFDVIRKSLAKAVLHFQNEFLRSDFNKGSLCQVRCRRTA